MLLACPRGRWSIWFGCSSATTRRHGTRWAAARRSRHAFDRVDFVVRARARRARSLERREPDDLQQNYRIDFVALPFQNSPGPPSCVLSVTKLSGSRGADARLQRTHVNHNLSPLKDVACRIDPRHINFSTHTHIYLYTYTQNARPPHARIPAAVDRRHVLRGSCVHGTPPNHRPGTRANAYITRVFARHSLNPAARCGVDPTVVCARQDKPPVMAAPIWEDVGRGTQHHGAICLPCSHTSSAAPSSTL